MDEIPNELLFEILLYTRRCVRRFGNHDLYDMSIALTTVFSGIYNSRTLLKESKSWTPMTAISGISG